MRRRRPLTGQVHENDLYFDSFSRHVCCFHVRWNGGATHLCLTPFIIINWMKCEQKEHTKKVYRFKYKRIKIYIWESKHMHPVHRSKHILYCHFYCRFLHCSFVWSEVRLEYIRYSRIQKELSCNKCFVCECVVKFWSFIRLYTFIHQETIKLMVFIYSWCKKNTQIIKTKRNSNCHVISFNLFNTLLIVFLSSRGFKMALICPYMSKTT